jgi:hypothetical protein
MPLTREEEAQLSQVLRNAQEREMRTARSSKSGFLAWLQDTTLGWLVSKLLGIAWRVIKRLAGF